ncbi:prepronociceptin [Synchiropus splendidus]|uniref:prepronociceptin n=1 Tax=Synchiropus splendidus TaxID=270530 RepID=UPI00237EC7BD|nr:prepronociceptin [Synchiropus splendidus]
MRTLLLLLLLCWCDTGHSDCQSDCLTCSNLLAKQVGFSAMVCLLGCEGSGPPALSWDCRRALLSAGSWLNVDVSKRSEEQAEALFPQQEDPVETELLLPTALERFQHLGSKTNVDLAFGDEYQEETGQEEAGQDVAAGGEGDVGLSLAKRFGGFVKGRHGYRKFMSPARSYQKRYGGFIGIRKSARKWNNQKRFSEFLKQYLGMSARASEFNSVSQDLTQQNHV